MSIRPQKSIMSEVQPEAVLMVDGAARGNPGEAGCGAVIVDAAGNVLRELSCYLGRATNNVAEYEGLLLGLQALSELGKRNIRVQSDSQLLVRQLNGEYRVRDEKLKRLFDRAMHLLKRFDSVQIVHVPRELNKHADRLANKGIDQVLKRERAKAD